MRGKITYKVRSREIFILSLLRMEKIPAYEVRQKGEDCLFSVRGKDKDKAERLLLSHEKEFTVISDRSARTFSKQNAGRIGVFVGLTLIVAGLVIWSQLITKAVVSGNERIEEEKILSAVLAGEDLPKGKKQIDVREGEKRAVAVDGISNASVEVKGCVLFIRVTEELEEPQVSDYAEIKDRVSLYDGVVTSVVSLGGTPLVQEGDVVKKGNVLLSCVMTDEEGKEKRTRAFGMVYGRVWVTKEVVLPQTVLVSKRTGRTKSYYVGIRSTIEPKPPFSTYEKEEESLGVSTAFGYKKVTYYETEEREEIFDYEGKKERVIQDATAEIEKSLPENAKKIRTWYDEKTLDKNHLLVIYYEIVVNLLE